MHMVNTFPENLCPIGSKMAEKPGPLGQLGSGFLILDPLSGFREIDFKNCKLAPNGSRNSHGNDINPGHQVAFLKSGGVYCLVIILFHINRSLFKFTHRINEGNKEIMSPEVVSPWPDLPLSIMEPSKEVVLPQGLQMNADDADYHDGEDDDVKSEWRLSGILVVTTLMIAHRYAIFLCSLDDNLVGQLTRGIQLSNNLGHFLLKEAS